MKRILDSRRALRLPFYGWAVAAIGLLAIFASAPGQSYGFSVFIDSILADTGMSRTELSALYALGTGVSAITTLMVGRLVDRLGARVMLVGVGLAFGGACFLMAAAQGSFSVLLGFAALRALGQGSLPILATLLIAQWFMRYRGQAMALVQLGGAASNAVFPLLGNALIIALDWRDAYRVLGVIVWAIILPAAILVVRNRPEDMGLHPDGLPQPAEPTVPPLEPMSAAARRPIWRTSRFWMIALPTTAAPFVITALVFHQASIFAERGLAPTVAAGIFVAMASATALTNALTGMLIGRTGPRRMLFVALGLLLLALQLVRTPLGAVLYGLILGAAAGTQGVTVGVVWAHYYGRTGLGRIQGAAGLIMISAAAVAPLPLAALQAATGTYTLALWLFTLLPLLCAAILAAFRPPPAGAPTRSEAEAAR
jgi:MFS family permease